VLADGPFTLWGLVHRISGFQGFRDFRSDFKYSKDFRDFEDFKDFKYSNGFRPNSTHNSPKYLE